MPIFSNRPESNVIQRSLRWLIAPTVFLFFAFAPYNVRAQSTPLNQRVLVVYNSADPDSTSVANYYIAQRAIPAGNLCPITPSSTTFLAWGDFVTTVKAPIQSCLNAVGASNILYIVFAYKTPYDVIAPDSNTYAVDEFIADIWDQYIPANQFGIPLAAHPYYAVNQAEGNVYVPFQSLATFRSQNPTLIYAVWRLDAPTAALAKGLVDKALLAESTGLSGQVCIDETSSIAPYDYDNGVPEWDLRMAAQFARLAGFSVTEDQNSAEFGTSPAPLRCDGAALYSGWYSFNNYNNAFSWNTGAIGFHLDSAAAADPRGGANWSANALLNGITVTHGAVSEPFVTGWAHPDAVFRNLFEGANVGDAFLRNTMWLKWVMLNIGDPLYRPFPSGFPAVTAAQNSLSFSPQYVIGGNQSTATITLATPAGNGGITFSLSSDQTAIATVPPTVTVNAGQTTASFPISTRSVAGDSPLLISATSSTVNLSNTLVPQPWLGGLGLFPNEVTGGSNAIGTVLLNAAAPAGGITVSLSSENSAASVPPTVTVPQGASYQNFTIYTNPVSASTSGTITASYAGVVQSLNLMVDVNGSSPISDVQASNITGTGATITWTTTVASDSQVAYGTTNSYGSATPLDTALVTSHSVTLTGLNSSTTYHYQVLSHDAQGNLTTSGDFTFSTTGPGGLIGYWNFDEGSGTTAHDTSGSGFDAAVNGAAWTTGELNSALSFDGGSGYVVTPAITLANTFTMSLWVNPAVIPQGGYARIAETQYNSGFYLGTDVNGTKYKFIVNGAAGSTGSCGSSYGCAEGGAITSGWHLLTATFDGSTARLYVDASIVATDTFTAPGSVSLPLYFGRFFSSPGFGWKGAIDEARLYNRALTQPEISALLTGGPTDTTPPSTPGNVAVTPVSSTQLQVSWTASIDNVGVAGYQVFRNGTLVKTLASASFLDNGLSPSTTYTYTIIAFDAAGNQSAPSTPVNGTTPAPDVTPPTVAITAPGNNAMVSGVVAVTANASDNVGVGDVQFQLDGVNLGPDVTSGPYSINWDTSTTSNGTHTLKAIARDTSNNSATSLPITVTVNNTVQVPPAQGLLGYWSFDEGSGSVANDGSGNGYTGTVNGAGWTAGKINGALTFNGTTNDVVTPGILLGNTFSISMWVNAGVMNEGAYARLGETQYNGGFYVGTDSTGTKYKFIVNTGAGATGSCGAAFGCAEGGTVTSGWHLVTATYDGTTGLLYVDNALVASETFTGPGSRTYPLYIGRYYGGNGFGWNGAIDEVRLYNRALTSTEVSIIYNYNGAH